MLPQKTASNPNINRDLLHNLGDPDKQPPAAPQGGLAPPNKSEWLSGVASWVKRATPAVKPATEAARCDSPGSDTRLSSADGAATAVAAATAADSGQTAGQTAGHTSGHSRKGSYSTGGVQTGGGVLTWNAVKSYYR